MMNDKTYTLGQILGCYFYQDWPDEFDSDVSVLQAIVESETVDQIRAGVEEIDILLAAHLSESELRDILINKVGCYFDPESQGITCEQWLKRVREVFSQV
ncbi:contact-dependent growth inhibition system immunity protein [Zobellella sp. DQSA1]|uniref:contact-dependent growth inhibition system immunity protein n=1 Tax=Zobellella sp. DQSA1 TaxID=3342386 RepID=UPI0035BEF9C1